MMCLLRLLLSLATAIAFHVTATSPTNRDFVFSGIPTEITIAEVTMRLLLRCKSVVKIAYWSYTASEVFHILSSQNSQCQWAPSPTFWIGTTMALAGGWIRFLCYRALGNMFTFTWTIQPGHKLITHGPYAIVRHPSYTASTMCVGGIVMAQASPDSWLWQSGMLGSWWVLFVLFIWLASMGIVSICLVFRMEDEEGMLKEMFEDEWKEWAGRVKYRLVPGVY